MTARRNARVCVAQVVPDLRAGGAERVALDLALHLDSTRFEVTIVTLYPSTGSAFEREARAAGVALVHLNKRRGFDPRILLECTRAFATLRPDVVHSHMVVLHNILPSCMAVGVPVRVHTVHNTAQREFSYAARLIHYVAFRFCGVFPVSISDNVRASIQAVYGDIPTTVVPNGLNAARFQQSAGVRDRWRRENSIEKDALVFTSVGRLAPQKNPCLLVDAFVVVARERPDAVLLLAGDGELLDAVKGRLADTELAQRVRLLGLRADIPELLNASDVFVSSSDWEGLPVAILEAMAAGLPVVATAVGGVPELVEQGQTGLLVPARNREHLTQALLEISGDQGRALAMGQRGRSRAESYSVEKMASRYAAVYETLLEGRGVSTFRDRPRLPAGSF